MEHSSLSADDEKLLLRYLDAMWTEKGLSDNTLASYRRDLIGFGLWQNKHGRGYINTEASHIQGFLADRFQEGISARSSARFFKRSSRIFQISRQGAHSLSKPNPPYRLTQVG